MLVDKVEGLVVALGDELCLVLDLHHEFLDGAHLDLLGPGDETVGEGDGEAVLSHEPLDDLLELGGWDLEELGEIGQLQGLVVGPKGKQHSAEAGLSDLEVEHTMNRGGIREEVPEPRGEQQAEARSPIAAGQRLGGCDHVVACVLRRPVEQVPVVLVDEAAQVAALEELAVAAEEAPRGRGRLRDLEQHRARQEDGVQQLDVDVHVGGQLALALGPLLLGGALRVLGGLQALRQQLLGPPARADLLQRKVGVLQEAPLEGSEAQLGDRAVVEDLRGDLQARQALRDARGREELLGLGKVPVQRQVVDVAQQRTHLHLVAARPVHEAAQLRQRLRVGPI